MKRAIELAALALAALLAGCGGHANVQANSAGASAGGVPGGTTANIQGRSNFGNLLGLGFLVGVSYAGERGGTYYSSNPFMAFSGAGSPADHAPDLDPTRRVAVQDCTRPIEDWSSNLKCK